ncbi:MAG: protocatechuate 3,4-dioxygenase [Lentisphaeraceae bacterium]|nr:protocatechuate 3,4-dioxygenase [Lentisphaeraceae bacterium]
MAGTDRRNFIKGSVVGGAFGLSAFSLEAGLPTPSQTAGPFYPLRAQKDKDFDLTKIAGTKGVAKGKIIIIHGQVLDTNDQPIEDAIVDLWQANAAGRYRHPHDSNKAALDANFDGWAIVRSGKNGEFRFKTIFPGAYLASGSWTRPPHIHFKITKKGYVELVTQMYFSGNKLNDVDRLIKRKSKKERAMMIAAKVDSKEETYRYNIVLEKK